MPRLERQDITPTNRVFRKEKRMGVNGQQEMFKIRNRKLLTSQ